jgi:hypothetical protein
MLISEILIEGYTQVWGRKPGGKMVRRYRCTDGRKKGRVVAKPQTCGTAINTAKSRTMSKTRRTKSTAQSIKRSIRMKHPTSMRVKSANKSKSIKKLQRKRK